jgi:hypothetical protein
MPKRPFVRRLQPDRSQVLRRAVQSAFVALNVWIGVEFYLFVRQFERGLNAGYTRPPGVEGWLPIAGLINLKYALVTGTMPQIHPAAMVLLASFLVISLLLRRSFCSWICPVGTFSEWLWKLGRSTFKKNWALPRLLDLTLRPLKYLLLAFFVFIGAGMSAEAIGDFMRTPYGVLADVKMLDFFRDLSLTSAMVLAFLILASVFVQNFWCRYLCPYGALTVQETALRVTRTGLRRATGLPVTTARRPPDPDPLSRMHRMHGMRRFVPGGSRFDTASCKADGEAGSPCRRHRSHLLRRSDRGQVKRPLVG